MTSFKCKMCGAPLEFNEGTTVAKCEFCGTTQTLPKLSDDRKANLYDRANHFRRNNEFDKAMGIYEQILNEDTADAEAYWSLVLCRYGIEYVEDPVTHKRVPTVNRAQFTSIFDDDNYKSAMKYADGSQRIIYEQEAKAINEIQKGILAFSQKEEPFDVFICYKETDNNGRRTHDSVLANDLYHQLTQEGFKVFFARITLEDKLGTAYEPYIFAALNSAKVMVVLGTKPEHFNAVWVKNEWSRYLALVKKSGGKKVLIPAYRDMDPYDLPEEFSHLQAQDMSKLGFMQDLIRGIKKIAKADEPKVAVKETVVVGAANANIAPLIERAFLFLEDGKWQDADIYCEKVLDLDPKNAEAYLGKLMAELQVRSRKQLADCAEPFDSRDNYKKVLRFGDEKLEAEMRGYITHINERNENARLTGIYNDAVSAMNAANTDSEYIDVAETFKMISGFQDADSLAQQCLDKVEVRSRKIEAVARAFKEGIQSKVGSELEERLSEAKMRVDFLEWILSIFDETQLQIQFLQSEFYKETSREKQLVDQRSRLGLFSGKEKKRIDEELSAVSVNRSNYEYQIRRQEEMIGNYSSVKDVERDLKEAKISLIDIETQIESARQNTGMEYGLEEACDIYLSQSYLSTEVNKIYPLSEFIPAVIGKTDTFFFGEYVQNPNEQPEPIEWEVLVRDNRRMLLISKFALDCKPYNISLADVTWETCSLRTWLNDSFIKTAFSSKEQNCIISSTVTADKNPSYSISPGNNTTDKIFLLSYTEMKKIFSSSSERKCQGTAYCFAQGAYKHLPGDYCWWWLRSPGGDSNYAIVVGWGGEVGDRGLGVNQEGGAVRPVMWIDLKSLFS